MLLFSVTVNIAFAQTTGGTDLSGDNVTASNVFGAAGTSARMLANMAADCTTPASYLASGQTEGQLQNSQIDVGPIINTMIGQNISKICLPQGHYLLNTTINLSNNTSIIGVGAGTELEVNIVNGDAILASSASYNTLRDFTLKAQVVRTGGAAIHLQNTFHEVIEHVYLQNDSSGNHYDGIYADGANDTHILDTEMRGGSGDGIRLGGTTQHAVDTYISGTNINGRFNNDVELQWASGIYLNGMDLLGAVSECVRVDPSASQEVDGLRATLVLADSNSNNGWHFTGSGPITETSLTNCWGATNGYTDGTITGAADGIRVDNTALNNLVVQGSEFHNNTATGIEIYAGENIIINGNTSFNNGRYASNTYSGISVGTAASYVVVANNVSGQGGINAPTANVQRYGINSVSTNYISVTNNITQQNMMGSTNIAAGANVYVAGNIGN